MPDEVQGQVDWEVKFHKAVSTNVRQSQMHKEKSAGWLRDLQVATQRIAELENQVKKMTPAQDRYVALQLQAEESGKRWAARVSELKEQNAKLTKLVGQSQREVLETMATWLQGQINRLLASEVTDA